MARTGNFGWSTSSRGILAVALAAALSVGCGAPAPSPSSPMATVAVDPAEFIKAKDFRESFGLRADDGWVERVLADPSASFEFGVALTDAEVAALQARTLLSDAVAQTVTEYARQLPEFAGVRIRQDEGGIVELRVTRDADAHRAALAKLLHPDAALRVIEVEYTRQELDILAKGVARDSDWMSSIPAAFVSAGVDDERNQALIRISSPHPDAADLVLAHYGVPELMDVESDGTGVALIPYADVILEVVDEAGRPVAGLDIRWQGDLPGIGNGDVGYMTDGADQYVIKMQATGQTISLFDRDRLVGSAHVEVRMDRPNRVRIEVEG